MVRVSGIVARLSKPNLMIALYDDPTEWPSCRIQTVSKTRNDLDYMFGF